jgi:hypothetical protein
MPDNEDKKNFLGRWRNMMDDRRGTPREPTYKSPKAQPPEIPKPLEIPSTSMFETLEYYYIVLCNYKDWLFEYFLPYHWRDHESMDPMVRQILHNQEIVKKARIELLRNSEKRKKTLRFNYKEDITKVQQNRKIFQNWYDDELANLQQKRDLLEGIVPQPGTNYEAIPGWVTKEGDSYFRGQEDLCQKLQCFEQNTNNVVLEIKDKLESHNVIQNLQQEVLQCRDNNIWKDQRLKDFENKMGSINQELTEVMEKCLPSTTNQLQLPSSSSDLRTSSSAFGDSDIYNKLVKYQQQLQEQEMAAAAIEQTNQMATLAIQRAKDINMLGDGNWFEQFTTFVLLPVKLCDWRSPLWQKKPPLWPVRYMFAIFLMFIWYQVAMVLFRIINYGLDFLPTPPNKEEKKSSKKRSKNKTEESVLDLEWVNNLKNIFHINRGGGRILDLKQEKFIGSIDPIFILIHIEKIKLKMNQNKFRKKRHVPRFFRKLRKGIKINQEFVLHLGLAVLTVGNPLGSIATSRQIFSSQEIYEVLSNEETLEISSLENIKESTKQVRVQAGNTIINFKSLSEPVEDSDKVELNPSPAKISRKNRTVKKPGKTVRLSDLPPLSKADFEELVTESVTQYRNRIRTK